MNSIIVIDFLIAIAYRTVFIAYVLLSGASWLEVDGGGYLFDGFYVLNVLINPFDWSFFIFLFAFRSVYTEWDLFCLKMCASEEYVRSLFFEHFKYSG
jgi:hypothetical protein